jgi:hypothetical protein
MSGSNVQNFHDKCLGKVSKWRHYCRFRRHRNNQQSSLRHHIYQWQTVCYSFITTSYFCAEYESSSAISYASSWPFSYGASSLQNPFLTSVDQIYIVDATQLPNRVLMSTLEAHALNLAIPSLRDK